MLTLTDINALTGGRLGQHDVACPMCGPARRSPVNRRRKVLRVYRIEPGFATFHCARCGEKGHTRDRSAPPPNLAALARARAEAIERERVAAVERTEKSCWIWSQRQPIAGTIAETYLRAARGYNGRVPATLGFLPARGKHGPAMIAGFGMATEPAPAELDLADHMISGVHLTRLAADGLGKAGTETDKIMLGASLGSPIVLAPVNDIGGLAIAEGIEDALSAHEATGLGAWAAGSASRLPALAEAVPAYTEVVTLLVDSDRDGRRHATTLGATLRECGFDVRMIVPAQQARRRAA
jgi:hypothetical protein